MTERWRWQDLHVGMEFTGRAIFPVSQQTVDSFGALTWDNDPVHIDQEAAYKSLFGRPVAQGLLGLAVAHSLMSIVTDELGEIALALAAIDEWRFRRPIAIPDQLRTRYTLTALRASRSVPGRGTATFTLEVLNQRAEVVQEGRTSLRLRTTDPSTIT